jgi:Domain of unknown function (DUF4082)
MNTFGDGPDGSGQRGPGSDNRRGQDDPGAVPGSINRKGFPLVRNRTPRTTPRPAAARHAASTEPTRWRRIRRRDVVAVAVLSGVVISSVAAAHSRREPTLGPVTATEATLFGASVPRTDTDPDSRSVELGVRFEASQKGAVTGVRFYRGAENTGKHVGRLWDDSGELLAEATFSDSDSVGWQQVRFAEPVSLTPGDDYVVSYLAPNGKYSADKGFFERDHVSGPLTAKEDQRGKPNGLYKYGEDGGFPTQTWYAANYYVDVLFRTGDVPGATPPPTEPAPTTPGKPSPTKPAPTAGPISPTPKPTPTEDPDPDPTGGPGTPPTTLPGWPSASNTGVHASGLKSVGGDQMVDSGWVRNQKLPGSGTQSDPYVLDKYLVEGMLHVNLGNSTYIKVTNSRIYGGDFYGVWLESGVVTITDTTIAPKSGGRPAIGIVAYRTGTFLRNDISGWNIGLMVQGDGPYVIQDNYFHDTYFQAGDHTDVINMNPHASNGVIKHNWIDGGRMDGQYTHNGIGLYNDATPGQGTAASRNWTVDGNYITRNNYQIYAAATPPFVIKNNIITTKFKYGAFYNALSGETDGGGNVDENGKTVRIG